MFKQTLSGRPRSEAITIMPVASNGFGHSTSIAPVQSKPQ